MAMSNFSSRLITTIALIAFVVLVFVMRAFLEGFGMYFLDAVFLILLGITTWELIQAKTLNRRGSNIFVACVVYGLIYFFYLLGGVLFEVKLPWWLLLIMSLVVVTVFTLFIALSNLIDQKFAKECRLAKKDLTKESWGGAWDLLQVVIYPGISFACLILLNHMTQHNLAMFGLLLIAFTSALSDILAYVTGMLLGKGANKMAVELSPKKTWVGFVGGLIGGVIGALIVVWIISGDHNIADYLISKLRNANLTQVLFVVVGLVGAIMTALGDLYASYIKRRCKVKDFGHILPGHGGFMDRMDGIIFNAPFILLIMGII